MSQSLKDMFFSVAGVESADLEAQVVEVAVVSAEEAAEAIIDKELADHEKDLAENVALVEKQDTAIEILEEKVEALEECVEGMESMADGRTPFNAALFAHYHKTGVKISNSFGAGFELKGAECFADVSTAQINGFEDIGKMKDIAVKGIEAGKKFLTELFKGVVSAISAAFNAHGTLAKRAEAMLKVIDSKESKDGEITIPGYLKDNGSDDYLNKVAGAFGTVTSSGGDEATAAKIGEQLKLPEGSSRSVKALSIGDCKSRLNEVISFGKGLNTIKTKAEEVVNNSEAAMKKLFGTRSESATDKFDATKAHANLRKSVTEMMNGIKRGGDVLKAKMKAVQDSVADKAKAEPKKD